MLTSRILLRWFVAFVFTQIVEVPIYQRTLHPSFAVAFGASAITHPMVWLFLVSHVWDAPWIAQAILVELFAWLCEAAYFRFLFGCRRSLVWTFVANAASLTLGLVAHALFHWP